MAGSGQGRQLRLHIVAAMQLVGAGLGVVIAGIAAFVVFTVASGNFHAVIPGELYRSAQPSGAALARYRNEYGIRTVLNLRGPNESEAWYRDEVASAEQLGLTHIDFRMSARRGISNAEAFRLIQIMRTAPKPILIHCESGADRSGLASALYLAAISGAGEEAAEEQLGLRYGHIAEPWGKGYGMTVTFEAMEAQLGFPDS